MVYITSKRIPIKEIATLYNDVGWYNYTYDLNKLSQAFIHSLYILSVWDDTELIGLIRLVGDGISIIVIQDLLVKRQYQNHGIGSKLLGKILSRYDHTMQIVCITDDQESSINFYKKHDLKPVTKYNIVGMANIKSHI